jgi:hypothetical protein
VLCEQDKRVLLVKVPAGESIPLRQRISTSLLHEFTKQVTVASDQDMIAFNVQSQSHANEILEVAKGLDGTAAIAAMIDKGNEMSHMRSVQGAQDIYPLRRVMAEQLYGSSETGYHEVLGRKRFGCATRGPVELHLHDGSTQRTLAGVLVYVPPKEAKVSPNEDQDPDMHGIEAGAFDSTYLASAASMKPFYLRKNSHLTQLNDADHVSKALHRLIEKLNEINLQIDLGSSASTLAKGLFSQQ